MIYACVQSCIIRTFIMIFCTGALLYDFITCVTLYNHSKMTFYHQFYGESKVETDLDLPRNGEY